MIDRLADLMPDDRPPAMSLYLNTKTAGTVAFAEIAGCGDTGWFVQIAWADNRSAINLPPFPTFLEAKRAAVAEINSISTNYTDGELMWRL